MAFHKTISNRISMLRPLLILGVVYVHTSGGASDSFAELHGVFQEIAGFFKNTLFRASVPMMSIIAGFLLFKANLDLAPAKMFKKKFHTLAIPFLFFNLGYVAFVLLSKQLFGVSFHVNFAGLDLKGWGNLLFGLQDYPLNMSLHFVRDMLVTMALVPVLSALVRNAPWLGLIAVTIVFGANFDGYLIIRGTSLVLFYIGALVAVQKHNVLALDKYAVPALVLLLSSCLVYSVFKIEHTTPLIVTLPFLVWIAAALLQGSRFEGVAMKYSKYSFFVFLAHGPVMMLSWWVVNNYMRFIPAPIYWLLAPILGVACLIKVYDLATRHVPTFFNFIIGARGKPDFAERRRVARPVNAPVYTPEYRLSLATV